MTNLTCGVIIVSAAPVMTCALGATLGFGVVSGPAPGVGVNFCVT